MNRAHSAFRCFVASLAILSATPSSGTAQPATRTAAEAQAHHAGIAAGLKETAVFVVMEKHYPSSFNAAVDAVERGLDQGRSMGAIQSEIRQEYVALLGRQTPLAEAHLLRKWAAIMRDQAESLVSQPADCVALLGFTPFNKAMQTVMSGELIAREQAWASEMLEQTAARPVKRGPIVLTSDETELISVAAYDNLSSDDSRKRIARLAGAFQGVSDPADQRAVCEFSASMFGYLASRSDEEAARLYLGLTAD